MLTVETRQHYLSYFKILNQITKRFGITLNAEDFSLELSQNILNLVSNNYYDNHHKLNLYNYEEIEDLLMCDEKDEQGKNFHDVKITFYKLLGLVGSNFTPCQFRHVASDEVRNVEHTPGQVLILDFWGTWSPQCISSMNHKYEMIEKNFDSWNGKVKFISASLFLDIEVLLEDYIIKNNWNRFDTVIEQFINIKSEGNAMATPLGVISIPYHVVVDKFGVVRNSGNFHSYSLESIINQLIDEEVTQQKTVSSLYQENETTQKLKFSLIEALNNFKTTLLTLNYGQLFNLDYKVKGKVIESNWSEFTLDFIEGEVKLEVELRENEMNGLMNMLNQLFPDYNSYDWFNPTFKVLEVIY